MAGGVCGRGGGNMHDGGGMHGKGACMAGGGMRGRRDGHCSGRYASYWNAFLFQLTSKHILFVHTLPMCHADPNVRKCGCNGVNRTEILKLFGIFGN